MRTTLFCVITACLAAVTESTTWQGNITCFVVRTTWNHGSESGGNGHLVHMMDTLKNQTSSSWVARFAVLDSRPFSELRRILRKEADDRFSVAAEWIGAQYRVREGDSWAPGYLDRLYKLTDEAIRGCPPWTKMVVVANGDDLFDPAFLAEVEAAADSGADIVASDYYSRFQRPTASPCERFAAGDGMPPCKENMLRACQTDLSANAYRWTRLMTENRYFSRLGVSEYQDGVLTSTLVEEGWKVHRLPGRCLVQTINNPQRCAEEGYVWDDAFMWRGEVLGGTCASWEDIKHKLRSKPMHLELVLVNLTFDANSFGFKDKAEMQMRCMRQSDPSKWQGKQHFGRLCAADLDYASLPEDQPAHPLDSRFASQQGETEKPECPPNAICDSGASAGTIYEGLQPDEL